ncbi:hypothetical protein M8J76_011214 [Diaphorina citri]|nr:hypothetical protein M8J76_011214 [Diaphorina citri]
MTIFKFSTHYHISISIALLVLLIGLPETKSKRSKNMSVRAAGIIIYRGARPYEFLLMKANYPPYHWSPPKGHHDGNETDIQAAVRETEEETGFRPGDYELNKTFMKEMTYIAHGRNKTVVYYMAKMKKDKDPSLSREHQAFKWVPLKEACDLFQHQEMLDLYYAADVHLVLNKPSDECQESELDFSNIPVASSENSKGTKE